MIHPNFFQKINFMSPHNRKQKMAQSFMKVTAFWCCIIWANSVMAQGWVRNTHLQSMADIQAHPDGGVVLATTKNQGLGNSPAVFLQHYSEEGAFLWEKLVSDSATARRLIVSDQGQLVLRSSKTFHDQLTRLDWNGNRIGNDIVVNNYRGAAFDLCRFPGGGFVGDYSDQANAFSYPGKITARRYSDNGTLLWQTVLDTFQQDDSYSSKGMAVNAAGKTLFCFRSGPTTLPRYWIYLLNADGSIAFMRNDVIPITSGVTADNQFFYISFESAPVNGYVMHRLDANGNVLYDKVLENIFDDFSSGNYLAMPDGGLVFAGSKFGLQGEILSIFKVNSLGETVQFFSKPLPGFDLNVANVDYIVPAPGGGYYLGVYGVKFSPLTITYYLVKMDTDGGIYAQQILGKIGDDTNLNCSLDSLEQGLDGFKLQIEDLINGNSYYVNSYGDGFWASEVDTSQFRITPILLNPYWESCSGDSLVSLSGGDSLRVDFPLHKVVECPFLEVDVATSGLRRCFNNTYYVRYCNTGTADAQQAYVEITLDPHLRLISSDLPADSIGLHQYRFQLGDLPFGDCGNFSFLTYLDCDSTVLGQSHCVTAHIYPDTYCLPNGNWSGANVETNGTCHPDSVHLVVKNTGTAPNSTSLDFVIIEDNIIFLHGSFQLNANDSLVVKVPANGSTWRIEAEQEPFSPGDPMPSSVVEACGANSQGQFSIGFVSQFDENDGNPYVSTDCQENKGSFDPNDKQGFPRGVGSEHWIDPGTEIDYLIRFQNTGTDTAFTVVVRDTLDTWLDPASVRAGASSHGYTFQMTQQGILKFTFNGINLPDSNVNVSGSQGFVKFKVRVRPDVPLQTVVMNRAGIYFDFNAPVLTNTTKHRIGKDYLLTFNKEAPKPSTQVMLYPNPAQDYTVIGFKNSPIVSGHLDLMDVQGRIIAHESISGSSHRLKLDPYPAGVYFIRVFDGKKMIGCEKLVLSVR